MFGCKKGNVAGMGLTVGLALIGMVVLFSIAAVAYPLVSAAGTTLNTSGLPFGSFWAGSNAITGVLIAVAILIAVVAALKLKK